MDICVCKSEIKTDFPDSSNSGHEENNSVQTAGPDIKHFVKIETCDYEYHDTSNPVKQIVNVSSENLVNEMEIKEEKLFHFQESLDIEKEEKAEPDLEKPLNFDLANEEIQRLNAESMEFDQGI